MVWVPRKNDKGVRVYGAWAGNTRGVDESPERCIASVTAYPSWQDGQCSRKRGHGPDGDYCKQHGKMAN